MTPPENVSVEDIEHFFREQTSRAMAAWIAVETIRDPCPQSRLARLDGPSGCSYCYVAGQPERVWRGT